MSTRLLTLVLLIGGFLGLAGCAGNATPLCDQAGTLLARAQLAEATGLYARTQQQGEGSCADDGLTNAGEAYTEAFAEVAAGSRAEISGDRDGASGHYEAALQRDAANSPALAGLSRLAPGTADIPATIISIPTTPERSWWDDWSWLAVLVLALLVLGGEGVLVTRLRRLGRDVDRAGESANHATKRTSELSKDTDDLREQAASASQLAQRAADAVASVQQRSENLESSVKEVTRSAERATQTARTATSTAERTHDELAAAVQLLGDEIAELRAARSTAAPSGGNTLEAATSEPLGTPIAIVWAAPSTSGADDAWLPEVRRLDETDQRVGPHIVVVQCRGVQIGERVRQMTVMEYRVQGAELDFADLLGPPDIADALCRLALDPDDDNAEDAAADALHPSALVLSRSLESLVELPRGELATDTADEFWDCLNGTVIVRDSQSVFVGDGPAVRNTFLVTISPSISGAQLLADHPTLVPAVLDAIRSNGAAPESKQLAGAAEKALEEWVRNAHEDIDDIGVHLEPPPPGRVLRMKGARGVGIDVDQRHRVVVETGDAAATLPSWREVRAHAVELTTDAQRDPDDEEEPLLWRDTSPTEPH